MFGRAAAARLMFPTAENRHPAPIERYTPKYSFHAMQDPDMSRPADPCSVRVVAIAFLMRGIGSRRIARLAS
jgi:hypothetical protein